MSAALALLGTPRAAHADPIKDLIDGKSRPTMAQVEAVAGSSEKDPFGGSPTACGYVEKLISTETIARGIAAMEVAFPGASLFELGRDASILGDIFDAFYRSIGQPERVKRLDASRPSFTHSNYKRTYGFLKTNGFDVTKIIIIFQSYFS